MNMKMKTSILKTTIFANGFLRKYEVLMIYVTFLTGFPILTSIDKCTIYIIKKDTSLSEDYNLLVFSM